MHKAYKDNDNLTAAISKEVEKSLKQYGKKNKYYLAKQVERNVKELTKGVDIEKNVNSLVSDTVAEIDSLHGLSLNSDLNEFNKQYEEMKYNTKAVYQKVPGRSKSAFNKMYDKANNMILDGDATIDQAVRSVTKNYKPTIQYKNGANVPMDSYLRMLYRTNQSNVAELRTNQIADALGTDVYEYSSHSEPREDCGDIQGKLVAFGKHSMVQVGENKKQRVLNIYDYGYGEPGGARGINCTHFMFAFTGFFRGKTKDVIGNMANAKENYKPPKQKKKGELKINNAINITMEDLDKVFVAKPAVKNKILKWMNDEVVDDGARIMIKNLSELKHPIEVTVKGSGAYYHEVYNVINLTTSSSGRTFIHELGHAYEKYSHRKTGDNTLLYKRRVSLPNNEKLEDKEKLFGKFRERRNKFANELKEKYTARAREINELYKNEPDPKIRKKLATEHKGLSKKLNKEIGENLDVSLIDSISDTIDGLTGGQVYKSGIGSGHGVKYFKREGATFDEIYTHTITLMTYKNKEKLDVFHDVLGADNFNAMVNLVKEDNPYWKEGFDYER